MNTAFPVHIRWMIRRDLSQVMAIESARTDGPWSEDDLLTHLRKRNVIGLVAEVDDRIVGYTIYSLDLDRIGLMTLAVNPDDRGQGVGTALIDRLKTKLTNHRRAEITILMNEMNLDALLFLRSQGFLAIDIVAGHDPESGADAYLMSYLPPVAYPDVTTVN